MIPNQPPNIHIDVKAPTALKSPLEQALMDRTQMDKIRQKYNLKAPKEMKTPTMQWEGEDHS